MANHECAECVGPSLNREGKSYLLDPVVAAEVAAAHLEAPAVGNALALRAYAKLLAESDRLFQLIIDGR
ncbi:MAG TPA: hypothetical protein VHS97_12420, partial [Isosphaeraceae bacterium]|nr:hypothetical protein [Isosphaeraceae bacterium]